MNFLYVLFWIKFTFTLNPKKQKTENWKLNEIHFKWISACVNVTNVFGVFLLIVVGSLAHATKNIRKIQMKYWNESIENGHFDFYEYWIRGTHSVCIRKLNWFWIMLFSLTDAIIFFFNLIIIVYRIVLSQSAGHSIFFSIHAN